MGYQKVTRRGTGDSAIERLGFGDDGGAASAICQAAKIKFPADLHSRAAYRKACKAAWRAEKLKNPQLLPPKA